MGKNKYERVWVWTILVKQRAHNTLHKNQYASRFMHAMQGCFASTRRKEKKKEEQEKKQAIECWGSGRVHKKKKRQKYKHQRNTRFAYLLTL